MSVSYLTIRDFEIGSLRLINGLLAYFMDVLHLIKKQPLQGIFYNALWDLPAISLLRIDIEEFSKVKNVGRKTIAELEDLQKQVRNKQFPIQQIGDIEIPIVCPHCNQVTYRKIYIR